MNYITYYQGITSVIYFYGYNFNFTRFAYLSVNDPYMRQYYKTETVNFFSNNYLLSSEYPEFIGSKYFNYEINSDNKITFYLCSYRIWLV